MKCSNIAAHAWHSKKIPLPWPQVLSNIAKRMADMHEAGYAHRDLKPANVMWLPRENRWTVIDFGCAARIGSSVPVAFTLAYAAPEVVYAYEVKQGTIEVTAAADVWSLGVMAFELLTGAPAFRIVTDGAVKVCVRMVNGVHSASASVQRDLASRLHNLSTHEADAACVVCQLSASRPHSSSSW
jgi:serine/threonine protein kinase